MAHLQFRWLLIGVAAWLIVQPFDMARAATQALALLEQEQGKIDLVLCDIEMPKMKGYELVSRIRHGSVPRFKDVPILMLTAHDSAENLQRAQYHSVSGFIPKTAMLEHVVAHVGLLQCSDLHLFCISVHDADRTDTHGR